MADFQDTTQKKWVADSFRAFLASGNDLTRVRSEGQRGMRDSDRKLLFWLCLNLSVFLRRDDILAVTAMASLLAVWIMEHCPKSFSEENFVLKTKDITHSVSLFGIYKVKHPIDSKS